MSREIHSSQVDYTAFNETGPSYVPYVVQPESGTSTTLSSQGQIIKFNLGASSVYNLSRSWLQFDLTIPAGGANNVPYLFADYISFFSQISFQSRSGEYLLDLTSAHQHSKATMK
ncbi:hypothetical protein ACTFIT_008972 [Dictyostelium discoideum]